MLLAGKRKKTIWLAVFCLYPVLSGLQSSATADTISDNLSFSSDSTPVALENVVLTSSSTTVGSATQLQARFTTPDLEFPFDYRVGVTFPGAFGFDSAVSATFSDDSPAPDPEIQAVEIIDHTVIFTLRRTFFAPKVGQTGIIDIQGVTLPTVSAKYSATVFISDIDFVVLAGPTFTNEIEVTPEVATSISVSPATDTLVTAGDLLTFSANSLDRYGNPVADSTLSWSLTADSDSLGVVTPGNLQATRTGSGRIVVSSSIASDTSGLITVVAGNLARLELDIDRQQYVGGGICGAGVVRAFDKFDNPGPKFNRADTLLQLSVSAGNVIPAVIPVSAFDSDGVLDLAAASVRFEGFPGVVDISARVGEVVSPLHSLSITGIIIRPVGGGSIANTLPVAKSISVSFRVFAEGAIPVIIDSLVVRLPDGQIKVFNDNISDGEQVTVEGFLSPELPTPAEDDTLSVTAYGAPLIILKPGEACAIVSRTDIPLRYIAGHINQTERVDTLLSRSQYDQYSGFGLSSPFSAQSVRDMALSIRDTSGVSFQFAGFQPGLEFDLSAVPAPLVTIKPIPSSVAAGLHAVTVTTTLTDGVFTYQDTSLADSQLYLIKAARFEANAADLRPASGSPGESVSFSLPVTTIGSFDDSAMFNAALQLYTADTSLNSAMTLSNGRDGFTSRAAIRLPLEYAQSQWGVRLLTRVTELSSRRTDTLDLGGAVFQIGPLTQITITDLSAEAPNFPFVNAGQQFNLLVRLVNNAPFEVSGVQVEVDTTVVAVGAVGAGDTVDVTIPFAAGEPSALQIVTANVMSENGARDESSAQMQFTVQRPALLTLRGTLNADEAADGVRLIEAGSALALQLILNNDGDAEISGGIALVTAGGAGLDFSAIVDLSAPVATVTLGVPSLAGNVNVTATVLDKPQELNTAEDAAFTEPRGATFAGNVTVVDRELLVNAGVTAGDTSAIAFGERREMFAIELGNASPLEDADVEALSLAVFLRDANGNLINPAEVIDVSRSALFDYLGKAVAILRVAHDTLLLDMTPNTLKAGDRASYSFVAQFVARSDVRTFTLSVPADGIRLKVIAGQRAGALFAAQSPAGAPPFESREYTLTAGTFVESFQPQNNPFDPNRGSTQYSYTLSADSDIELSIYTLGGKLVRRYSFTAGSQFAAAGVQTPAWDGRNGAGAVVRDGVYVVVLTNLSTGEKAYLKQAVLK